MSNELRFANGELAGVSFWGGQERGRQVQLELSEAEAVERSQDFLFDEADNFVGSLNWFLSQDDLGVQFDSPERHLEFGLQLAGHRFAEARPHAQRELERAEELQARRNSL